MIVSLETNNVNGAEWYPNFDGNRDYAAFGPDLQWSDGEGTYLSSGDSAQSYVFCRSTVGATFVVTYYDPPETPTAFSGRTTPVGSGLIADTEGTSKLVFQTPYEAQYVADLQISQGGVKGEILGQRSFSATSSGQFPLGTLGSDSWKLSIDALDGPQALWTVSIRAKPVVVSDVSFSKDSITSGKLVKLRYTTSGDTAITATIKRRGKTIRSLASGLKVSRGDHTLTWDGRSASGSAARKGVYVVDLRAVDPSGSTSDASAKIRVKKKRAKRR